jgi:hypothetical protein
LEELTRIRAYQTVEGMNRTEPSLSIQSSHEFESGRQRSRLLRLLGQKIASTAYVRKAVKEQVTLEAFKTLPSAKFSLGVGLVLFSYVLGWPMVGFFSILSAYFQAPALLMVGPASYGFSHLVWLFGIYLAGEDSIKYANIVLSWGLRKAVEKTLNREPNNKE